VNNTWIEVNIPCQNPLTDFLFRLNELLINTCILWGWLNYTTNLKFGVLALALTAFHWVLGILSIVAAGLVKIKAERGSEWADGDTWLFAWYVFLLQWLTENALS
jgi:hypothetical protein